MISHYHKAIFIHIPKCAGTSIETHLLKDLNLTYSDKQQVLIGRSQNFDREPKIISHLTIEQLLLQKYITPEMLQQYFKFTVVRNPIDRLYSTYVYLGYSNVFSFDIFIQNIFPKLYRSKNYFLKSQYSFLRYNDQNYMDYVCRLESLNDDFKIVAKKLKLKNYSLPKINKSKQEQNLRGFKKIIENYNVFYKAKFSFQKSHNKDFSQTSRQILIDYYKVDFEKFGYEI